MAEAAWTRGWALSGARERLAGLAAQRELVALGAIVLLAGALRFWDLGDMALHHDESLHARYTWLLFDGQGYQHDPLMHGPFQFHAGALVYFLFGASDATSRFLPAIFGTILVAMPYLLRKQIGMPAVLIAAVLLAFSPTLLYFSRFYRNEAYMLVWTLGMAVCVWRYLDEGRDRYLYALAALLALSFATKEVTFITAALFLVFLDLTFAVEIGRRKEGEEVSGSFAALRTLLVAPVAWLIAAGWPLIGRAPFGLQRMPRSGEALLVIGTLALPQYAAGIQVLPFVGDKGYQVAAEDTLKEVTVVSLMLLTLYAGLLWKPRVWLIAAAAFYVPYVLLYTTFFTNPDGFFSGTWNSLDYWLEQHHVQRGDQPPYYYALLTPLYEFLPLLLALGGAAWLVLRGDSLRRWLVFWLAGIFVALTIAGEKMPWLEAHIALPLALAGAVALSAALRALELQARHWPHLLALAAAAAAATLLAVDGEGPARGVGFAFAAAAAAGLLALLAAARPRRLLAAVAEPLLSPELSATLMLAAAAAAVLAVLSALGLGVETWAAVWAAAIVPVAIAGYVIAGILRASKAFARGAAAVGLAVLLTLTVRASLTAAFTHDDTPVEMLVYTQTSHDIPDIMRRIDALAKRSGLGHNLRVVVDTESSFAWPWAWYLRDYHEVTFAAITPDYRPPAGAVLLISAANASSIDPAAYSAQPYKHRWWFLETYRGLDFHKAASRLTNWKSLQSLGRFFLYRRPAEKWTGSVDAVAFFPLDLAAYDVPAEEQGPPREPVRLADGRTVLGIDGTGRGGSGRGEFQQPAGLFVDGAGSLWVADARNNRIQKFDAQGRFIAAFGKGGTAPGSFREPWSLAVDAEGFIYVADTWNHRIEKFSPQFEVVAAWGTAGSGPNAGPLEFFGPRDIAVAPDGSLWVTDTGNKRLLHFSPDGTPLGVAGSEGSAPGQLSEPVGLAYDAAGSLYVADAWNGRLQRFSPDLQPVATIAVGWDSRDVLAKPYVAVLRDGRVLVSEPARGQLLLYDNSGRALGAWKPFPDSMPVGVAALPDGGFAFSDARRNEVQIVPAGVIASLFQ